MKTIEAKPAISRLGGVITNLGRVDPMDFYRGMKDCSNRVFNLADTDRPFVIQSLQVTRLVQKRQEQYNRLRGIVKK